jgi:hypothetical protein
MEFGDPSNAEWVPIAFAVMSTRTLASYRAISNKLNDEWKLQPSYNVERIHIDYEPAEIGGLTEVFGTKIYGCLVHYIRALIRYLKTECPHLFRNYVRNKHGPIHRWV